MFLYLNAFCNLSFSSGNISNMGCSGNVGNTCNTGMVGSVSKFSNICNTSKASNFSNNVSVKLAMLVIHVT